MSAKKNKNQSEENNEQEQPFFPKLVQRFQKTLSSFINAIAEAIINSVHIPEIAIGPIIGSLITATTTIIIGFVTISNIFSEQFLYRPLQLQDNTANYKLQVDSYRQKVLTDYLNQVAHLSLEYPVWKLKENPFLLRAITQQTLSEIDAERKRYVIMFLKDASLLTSLYQELPPLLEEADLTEADLHNLQLAYANLSGANFTRAIFEKANLHKSNLSRTNLTNANLSNADLTGTSLEKSDLTNANLTNACYDVLTKFDSDFDPTKTKMKLIQPFENCPLIPKNKNKSNETST